MNQFGSTSKSGQISRSFLGARQSTLSIETFHRLRDSIPLNKSNVWTIIVMLQIVLPFPSKLNKSFLCDDDISVIYLWAVIAAARLSDELYCQLQSTQLIRIHYLAKEVISFHLFPLFAFPPTFSNILLFPISHCCNQTNLSINIIWQKRSYVSIFLLETIISRISEKRYTHLPFLPRDI